MCKAGSGGENKKYSTCVFHVCACVCAALVCVRCLCVYVCVTFRIPLQVRITGHFASARSDVRARKNPWSSSKILSICAEKNTDKNKMYYKLLQ